MDTKTSERIAPKKPVAGPKNRTGAAARACLFLGLTAAAIGLHILSLMMLANHSAVVTTPRAAVRGF